ncbi:MAG: hypothetical protein ACK5AZ_20890 [Bryobacteraceae bacterium]
MRICHLCLAAVALLAVALLSYRPLGAQQTQSPAPKNQTPAPYPPVGYPPGQYPPGQYPPGRYPETYPPGRVPGVGVPIPVPEIRLPRRGGKDDNRKSERGRNDKELTITLQGVEGALRELGEKDMVVESGTGSLLQFRLLAKTQFRDKDGEAIRDSLLKPGDQLLIEFNPDDAETALRVKLLRKGTPAERAEAAKPFDRAAVRSPDAEADGRPSVVGRVGGGVDSADDQTPRIRRGQPEEYQNRDQEQDAVPPAPAYEEHWPRGLPEVDPIIARAREESEEFSATLPDFIVQQYTTRFASGTHPPQWQPIDVVAAEVVYLQGSEEYRNVTVNGRPARVPVERTGSWSRGEFATLLRDVLSPFSAASYVRKGEDSVGGRRAWVYDLSVKQPNSNWQVHDELRVYNPAYSGSIWIDKETNRVQRIEIQALSFPSDFSFDKVESVLEYGFVRIGSETYLMPVHSENLMCQRGTARCSRNVIDFRNYRKFTAESGIVFDNVTKLK